MLREMILTFQNECIQIIVPVLVQAHNNFQESHMPGTSLQHRQLCLSLIVVFVSVIRLCAGHLGGEPTTSSIC